MSASFLHLDDLAFAFQSPSGSDRRVGSASEPPPQHSAWPAHAASAFPPGLPPPKISPTFRTHRRPLTSPTDRVIAQLVDADFPDLADPPAAPPAPPVAAAPAIAAPAPAPTPAPTPTPAPPPPPATPSHPLTALSPKPLPPDAHTCLLFTPDRPPRVLEAALRRKRLAPQTCHDPYTLLACAFAHVAAATPASGMLVVILCLPAGVSPAALPEPLLHLALTLRRLAPRALLWSFQPGSPVPGPSGRAAHGTPPGLRPLPLNLTPDFAAHAPRSSASAGSDAPPLHPPARLLPRSPLQQATPAGVGAPSASVPRAMPATHRLLDAPADLAPDPLPRARTAAHPDTPGPADQHSTPVSDAGPTPGPTGLSGKHPGGPPDRAGSTFAQVHTVSGRSGSPARAKPLPVSIVGNFLYFNPANSQESAMLLPERAAVQPAPRQEPRP